jgi:F1F0 ATPase subunit 2
MNPTDAMPWLLAFVAGGALGTGYFWGLWWTVRKSLASPRPALWVFGSLLLRMALALAGFYAVGGGDWQRLVACLIGFVAARQLVVRLTPASTPPPASPPAPDLTPTPENRHAPQP